MKYANEHVEMSRLDQILGKQGSKAKDVYASKISLASRVVKVERSVSSKCRFQCMFNLNGIHSKRFSTKTD